MQSGTNKKKSSAAVATMGWVSKIVDSLLRFIDCVTLLRKFIPPKLLPNESYLMFLQNNEIWTNLSQILYFFLLCFFQSPFFRHFKRRPDKISVDQWATLRRKAKSAVENYVKPSFKKLYGFLRYRYLQATSIFDLPSLRFSKIIANGKQLSSLSNS